MKIDKKTIEALKAVKNSANLIELIKSSVGDKPNLAIGLLDELATAQGDLKDNIDIEGLEKLVGKTPERGIDYFTDKEIQGMQDYLKANTDNISIELTEQLQNALVAYERDTKDLKGRVDKAIANVKNGKDVTKKDIQKVINENKDELRGDDGSPDTPDEVVAKVKSIRGSKRLSFENVKGLKQLAVNVRDNTDNIEEIKEEIKKEVTFFKSKEVDAVTTLDALTDVDITALADGEILVYNLTSGKWENQTAPEDGALTDQSFTPTNGQTAFILSSVPISNDRIFMFVNSATYIVGNDFTISGSTITWLNAFTMATTDIVTVRYPT